MDGNSKLLIIAVSGYFHWLEVIYALHSRESRFFGDKELKKRVGSSMGKFVYESFLMLSLVYPNYKYYLTAASVIIGVVISLMKAKTINYVSGLSEILKAFAFNFISLNLDWFDFNIESKLILVFLFSILNNSSNYLSFCLLKFKLMNYGKRIHFGEDPGNSLEYYYIDDEHISQCDKSEANLFVVEGDEAIINCPYSIFRNYFNYSKNVEKGWWEIPNNLLESMTSHVFNNLIDKQGYLTGKLDSDKKAKMHRILVRSKLDRAKQCKNLERNLMKLLNLDQKKRGNLRRLLVYIWKSLSMKVPFYFLQRVDQKKMGHIKHFQIPIPYCKPDRPALLLNSKDLDRKLTIEEMYMIYCEFLDQFPKKKLYCKGFNEFKEFFEGEELPKKGNFKIINFLYKLSDCKPSEVTFPNVVYHHIIKGTFQRLKPNFSGRHYKLLILQSFYKVYSRMNPEMMQDEEISALEVLGRYKIVRPNNFAKMEEDLDYELEEVGFDWTTVDPRVIEDTHQREKLAKIKKAKNPPVKNRARTNLASKKAKKAPPKAPTRDQEPLDEAKPQPHIALKPKVKVNLNPTDMEKCKRRHKALNAQLNDEFKNSLKASDLQMVCHDYYLMGRYLCESWKIVNKSVKKVKKRYRSYAIKTDIS